MNEGLDCRTRLTRAFQRCVHSETRPGQRCGAQAGSMLASQKRTSMSNKIRRLGGIVKRIPASRQNEPPGPRLSLTLHGCTPVASRNIAQVDSVIAASLSSSSAFWNRCFSRGILSRCLLIVDCGDRSVEGSMGRYRRIETGCVLILNLELKSRILLVNAIWKARRASAFYLVACARPIRKARWQSCGRNDNASMGA